MLSKFVDAIKEKYSAIAIICIVGLLLYSKSFFFGFTYLDDNALVLNNLPFLENIKNVFVAFKYDVFFMTHTTTAYFRPLLTISFMPEAIVGGSIPLFYHLVNVGIHLAAASLVYVLFTKLKYTKRISLFFSLIFVVHPVLTQAIAWIPGRNDSLLAVFVLASFIFLIDFIETGKRAAMLWSIIFFSLALFTKESAIVLPVLGIGYLWIRNRFDKNTLLEFGSGWLIALLFWLSLRIPAMTNPLPMSLPVGVSSFLENVPGTLQLLGKVFFPFNLSVFPIQQDTIFLWGYLATALIIGLVLFQLKSRQTSPHSYLMMGFGFAWFLAFLWPSFVKFDPGTPDFIEHRLYIPIIGLLILLAESCVGRFLNEMDRKIFLPFSLGLLFILFCMTATYENVFFDKTSFWKDAVSHSPHSSFAQKNLGAMYYLDHDYVLAEKYSKEALVLNSGETMVHNNLGLIYAGQGKDVDAEREYLLEIATNPYYDNAHYNLGLLYYKKGNLKAARTQWEDTLKTNPSYYDAYRALQSLTYEENKPI